jgi:hypothetical protein
MKSQFVNQKNVRTLINYLLVDAKKVKMNFLHTVTCHQHQLSDIFLPASQPNILLISYTMIVHLLMSHFVKVLLQLWSEK